MCAVLRNYGYYYTRTGVCRLSPVNTCDVCTVVVLYDGRRRGALGFLVPRGHKCGDDTIRNTRAVDGGKIGRRLKRRPPNTCRTFCENAFGIVI